MILTVDQLRQHVESDLGNDALTRLIEDAEAAIVARYGGDITDEYEQEYVEELDGAGPILFPTRRVDQITSVTEFAGSPGVEVETPLDPDDYHVRLEGREILRLLSGANGSELWGRRVVVTYTVLTDVARRRRVVIDLVKLALTYSGSVKSERAGDYSSGAPMSPDAYQAERSQILLELAPAGGIAFA